MQHDARIRYTPDNEHRNKTAFEMHRLLLRDHYKVVRIPLQHASTALCIDVGPHDHGLSNAGDLCADAKLLELRPICFVSVAPSICFVSGSATKISMPL